MITTGHSDSDLEFDAAVALVDDFVVGEPVHISLRPHGGSYEVIKIWPDDPRVPAPDTNVAVPDLDPDVAARIGGVLSTLQSGIQYRIHGMESDLVVREDDDAFLYGWQRELIFVGVEYLDLPFGWDGKTIRLANSKERAYLSTRCEIRRDVVAIKIVDEALHAYFVVCTDFWIGPGGTEAP